MAHCRNSGATATATRKGRRSTRRPGDLSRWSTAPAAATRSTGRKPGKNYGWPVITYGRDYSGAKIGEGTEKAGMEQPVHYWDPSIAPSGLAFYVSDKVPAWKGSLFIGALAGQHLQRLKFDGDKLIEQEMLLTDLGERIRDVRAGPDGALWLLTDSPEGRVLRYGVE